ncbi:Phage late control gene D protein (GPD) [Selenomonas sp. GACV-9]|uniref:contractile injection system protein, VgrG/Pvc8 family n=1 Tax=Selenomonas sp. GACV-9 TaxID=3158782 RepID=UPI0008E618E8|nr:Phage late control gene D protein (GPD) [Selenomonas ruminantium]
MEKVSIRNLHIEGFLSASVIDYFMQTHVGKHGRVNIRLEIAESVQMKSLLAYQNQEVKIYADHRLFFVGVVTEINLYECSGRREISLALCSVSQKMDIKKKSRTFQSVDKTLGDVARKVAAEYNAEVKLEEDMKIPRMLYQHNETDWEFLRRLCESLGKSICCDSSAATIRISIGFVPFAEYQHDSSERLHGSCVSYLDVMRRKENTRPQSRVDEFEDVKLTTYDLLPSAGYGVMLRDYEQGVLASKIIARGDVLENELIIRHKEGLFPKVMNQRKKWNTPCYIAGKVIDVKEQLVKVKFDCDECQDAREARWIPHENTVNNYMYSMPDIGDKIYVYFEECGELLALGSHRRDLGGNEDYHTPENRNLTSENQMIQFQPDSTVCVAGRTGDNSSRIIGDVQSGMDITSTENIVIHSEKSICLDAQAGNVTDEAYKLMDGFNKGYLKYLHDGGTPLKHTYVAASCGMIGKDMTCLCEASPLFEEPVKSASVNSFQQKK